MAKLVVGCGYLGRRVANLWNANQPDSEPVYALTRSDSTAEEFRAAGLKPIVGDITVPESLGAPPVVDTTLFAVGMDRSRYSDIRAVYVEGLQNVLQWLAPVNENSRLIYISSTGVYGNFDGDWIDESSPTNPSRDGGKACLEAEQLLLASPFAAQSTILRLAGIYGPGRVPTRATVESQQWQKLSASGFLNLIHVDDAAQVVREVAARTDQEAAAGNVFLVSDGNPPRRKDYYEFIANWFGIGEIPWDATAKPNPASRSASSKRVANRKLLQTFGSILSYPDFQAGLRHSLAQAD